MRVRKKTHQIWSNNPTGRKENSNVRGTNEKSENKERKVKKEAEKSPLIACAMRYKANWKW